MSNIPSLLATVDGPNLFAAAGALAQLKVALLSPSNQPHGAAIGQAACRLAVRQKDKAALERALTQLMPYFSLPDEYIALRLLLFLVESRLMDFFSELERLSIGERTSNNHVKFVASLERHLTEGGYNKALRARAEATSPLFAWLLEDFENTVRLHVASCVKAAFPVIGLKHAADLLNLASEQSLRQFAATQEGWIVSSDYVTFEKASKDRALTKESIPAKALIQECMGLAMELDRIV